MNDIPMELITKAAEGDMGAFEKIYRQTSGFVYSVALRVVRNATDADDVTQEVYIRVHRNLKGFGFRSAFRTWPYRITMNAALNACKRRGREAEKSVHDEVALEQAAVEPSQVAAVEQDERHDTVSTLLGVLTPEHRACIILREIEGLSYEEMADALHININTVRTRLKRAREALMARVERSTRPEKG
jgi:RNA polymerase sigma-70 factor, ECF subfamily